MPCFAKKKIDLHNKNGPIIENNKAVYGAYII